MGRYLLALSRHLLQQHCLLYVSVESGLLPLEVFETFEKTQI